MKRFHFTKRDVCVATAELPLYKDKYSTKQIMEFVDLFRKRLNKEQIPYWHIEYDVDENALFAYTQGDFECVEN